MIGLYEHFKIVLNVAFNDLYWWMFGNHNGWLENLSYVANIVMAVAAVIAGGFALAQLSHSKKSANLSFVMDLIDRIHEIHVAMDNREAEKDETKAKPAGSIRIEYRLFNLLEAYCGFLREKSVSGQARKALLALLNEEIPGLIQFEPYKGMLENSLNHPTKFENIRWFLARRSRKKYFYWF